MMSIPIIVSVKLTTFPKYMSFLLFNEMKLMQNSRTNIAYTCDIEKMNILRSPYLYLNLLPSKSSIANDYLMVSKCMTG